MAEQLDWGWTEDGHRRRKKAIQNVRLPRAITLPTNGSVSSSAVRHVLRVLNEYAGGDCETFVGRDKIAAETGLSVSQVKRALAALRQLGLASVARKKGRAALVCNHYRIHWRAVEALGADQPHPELGSAADSKSVATVEIGSAAASESVAPVGPQDGARVHHGPLVGERRSMVDPATVHHGPSDGPSWTGRRSMVDPDSSTDLVKTPSSTSWGTAAEELVRLGVRVPWGAIDQAKRRGATPERVLALAEHYAAMREEEGWQPGALYTRVSQDGPGLAIAEGWPVDPQRARRRKACTAAASTEHLERECGGLLDGLPPIDRDALARRVIGQDATLWSLYRMVGLKEFRVRAALLAGLLQELTPATS